MFNKLSNLLPGSRFRLLDSLGLPSGHGYILKWIEGGLYCCEVDVEGTVSVQYFNMDFEIFQELEAI